MDFQPTYRVQVQHADPNLAELHIAFAGLPEGVEVRGRLMGPRCPGVSTIEVAYHFQPLDAATVRVLIPEPSFWSADRPYVYEGPAEFHRGGQKLGGITVSCGLKRGD
jgi:hypothetical protein